MKRFVILLIVCLLLTACAADPKPNQTGATNTQPSTTQPNFGSTNDDDLKPMPGFDAQNKYLIAGILSFQETESFFCGTSSGGHYLQYYDKPSGISGALCADPACTHDSVDCGARVESGASLSYYDGKLYWFAQKHESGNDFILWQSDLSGMNRKEIVRLSFQDVIIKYQPQRFVIHRGRLYFVGHANTVVGTKVVTRISLVSAPLDGSGQLTVHYEASFEKGAEPTVRFVGNYVYLSMCLFEPGTGIFDMTIARYNIRTSDTETVYEVTGLSEAPGAIWVTEQGEIYLPTADAEHAYVWKLENGERVQVLSWDEKDYHIPNIVDGIALVTGRTDGICYIKVKALDGTAIYDGMLFPEGVPGIEGDPNMDYGRGLIGGDGDKLIMNLSSFINPGTDFTLMLDLNNNLKPTILWSEQK